MRTVAKAGSQRHTPGAPPRRRTAACAGLIALAAAGAWPTSAPGLTIENSTEFAARLSLDGGKGWVVVDAQAADTYGAAGEQTAVIHVPLPEPRSDFACKVEVRGDGVLKIERIVLHGVRGRGHEKPDYKCTSTSAGGYALVDEEPAWAGETDRDVRFLATGDPQFWDETDPEKPEVQDYNNWARVTLGEMRHRLAYDPAPIALPHQDPAAQDPRLRGALVAGDLTQDTKPWEWGEYLAAISDTAYAAWGINGARRHWFDTLGNHDLLGLQHLLNTDVTTRARTTVTTGSGGGQPAEGLYSWDWHDVHFVSAGEFASKKGTLGFLRADLRSQVRDSGRPVVILQHFGFDGFSTNGEWWTEEERESLWEAIEDYNVVAFITGHTHLRAAMFSPGGGPPTWWFPFVEPGRPAAKCDENCVQQCVDRRDCIPSFVAGAARHGVFLEAAINDDCEAKGWHEACLHVDRYGLHADSRFRKEDGHLLRIPVRPADTTPPVANPSVPPTATGWHREDVEIDWGWSDADSGIVESECDKTSTSTGEGDPLVVSASCTDASGNTASTSVSLRVDKSAPKLTLATDIGGWRNSDITVVWACHDTLSGQTQDTISKTVDTETKDGLVSASCSDRAGNTSTEQRYVLLDKTKPTITLLGPSPSGWTSSDVTVKWLCKDDRSGPKEETVAVSVTTEGENQSATGTCTDKAGNTATDTQKGIDIDKTKPTLVLVKAPPAGWASSDVTVEWRCRDTPSGPTQDTINETVSTEGRNQSVTGTCTDHAGNTATDTQTGIDIDKTAPVVTVVAPAENATYDLEERVAAAYECTDSGSGVNSCEGNVAPGDAVDTLSAGAHTFSIAARDAAANETNRAVPYEVRKARTALAPKPLLLDDESGSLTPSIGRVSAKLTYGAAGKPAAGRRVDFTAGSGALCIAMTGADGVASCTFGLLRTTRSAIERGYTATFFGDANLLPSSAQGQMTQQLAPGVPGTRSALF